MNKNLTDPMSSVDIFNSHSRFSDVPTPKNVHRYSICSECRNRTREMDSGRKKTCVAFPEGIPDKFILGEVDHTVPYTGDNGITFEP